MKIEVFSNPEEISVKDFEVVELSFNTRLLRASKLAGMFFGGALISAPIPVVHLIMVPLCLLLAVVTGIWRLRQKIQVHAPDLRCPNCQTPQALVSAIAEWPYRGHCPQCRAQFTVRPQV